MRSEDTLTVCSLASAAGASAAGVASAAGASAAGVASTAGASAAGVASAAPIPSRDSAPPTALCPLPPRGGGGV